MKEITYLALLCPCLHHRSSYSLENRTNQKTKVTHIQKSLPGQQNMSRKKTFLLIIFYLETVDIILKAKLWMDLKDINTTFSSCELWALKMIFYLLVAILNRMVWIYKRLRECSCAHCFSRFNPLNMHTFYGPLSLFLMRMSLDPLDTPTFRNHSFFIPPMYRNPRSVSVWTVKLNTS